MSSEPPFITISPSHFTPFPPSPVNTAFKAPPLMVRVESHFSAFLSTLERLISIVPPSIVRSEPLLIPLPVADEMAIFPADCLI